MTLGVHQRFAQRKFINAYPDTLGDRGVCYGFNLEITRWVLKHIAQGEAEDKIDVMEKLNSTLSKEGNNFAKRLALYQSEQMDRVSPERNISYKQNNFLDSLPKDMKDKKFIGFSFNTFDEEEAEPGRHTINIRRIGDSQSYEVIDVNFGSRKCKDKDELNSHIEDILGAYNNTKRQGDRGISVYDIEDIVRKRDLLPEPILAADSSEKILEKKQNNKAKKYKLDGSILLAINSESPTRFIQELIENADAKDINYQDENGKTALMYAIEQDNYEVMSSLLQREDIDVNLTDENGQAALIHAITRGNHEVMTSLLERDDTAVNAKDDFDNTALMYAAIQGDQAMVASLLQRKDIDVNLTDGNGKTALMYAIESENNQGVVEALLQREDIDLSLQDSDGLIAQDYAVYKGNTEIAELLTNKEKIQEQKDSKPLIYSSPAVKKDIEKPVAKPVEEPVEKPVEKPSSDEKALRARRKAFLKAVKGGDIETAQSLINQGVSLNVRYGDNRQTALMHAIYEGKSDIAQLLIDKGANLNIQDEYGKTALMCAISVKNKDIAKLLIDKGADLNLKDENHQTALMCAISNDNTDIAKLLIDKGADLNIQDGYGKTALMCAISVKNKNIAKLLIAKGADLNLKDENGRTAYDYILSQKENKSLIVGVVENVNPHSFSPPVTPSVPRFNNSKRTR